jgi:hypothetical protein
MDECTTQCKAGKMLVFGIILVLVRMFTDWDIWLVIGVLLIVKALSLFLMPKCMCQTKIKRGK